eukprot:2185230-Amphidinium_carterae.1
MKTTTEAVISAVGVELEIAMKDLWWRPAALKDANIVFAKITAKRLGIGHPGPGSDGEYYDERDEEVEWDRDERERREMDKPKSSSTADPRRKVPRTT